MSIHGAGETLAKTLCFAGIPLHTANRFAGIFAAQLCVIWQTQRGLRTLALSNGKAAMRDPDGRIKPDAHRAGKF